MNDPVTQEQTPGFHRWIQNNVRPLLGILFCVSLIGLSFWLTPNPNGFGTHTQLGLSECSFLESFGIPGPSCGMTTSFTYQAKGALQQAFVSHPFAVLLFWGLVGTGLGSMIELLFPVRVFQTISNYVRIRHLYLVGVLWVLSWTYKLYVFAGEVS